MEKVKTETEIERECRGEEKTVSQGKQKAKERQFPGRSRNVLVRKWVGIRNPEVSGKELGK